MVSSSEFKLRDSGSYDSVTESFDHFTERFTTPLARRLVDLAGLLPQGRVLDIGTGTGIVALEAARRMQPGGSVTGIDLSEGMLAKAVQKAAECGLSGMVNYDRMDAEQLSFRDGSFDAVLSLFALLHLPDPVRGLREMYRVLRPGGTLVVAVGSGVPRVSLAAMRHALTFAEEMIETLSGQLLCAPDFLNELVEKHLPEEREQELTALASESRNLSGSVPNLVRTAGFTNVQRTWHRYRAVLESVDEFWDLQRTYSSMARKRMAAKPEAIPAIREEFNARCTEVLERGGRLAYPYAALFITARRSG